jgi:hypothetical protein
MNYLFLLWFDILQDFAVVYTNEKRAENLTSLGLVNAVLGALLRSGKGWWTQMAHWE